MVGQDQVVGGSRISSEVDFERGGKQTGFLRLPHSVHRSAYGWLPLPVAVIKNGEGPSVLLQSGNHGDEYEGQVALCKLIRALQPEQIQGRIIFFPMANYPAAKAGRRTSPIDGGNLNRSFPGDPDGGPTDMIAHYIQSELMPRCQTFIDLHSGGSSLLYLPTAMMHEGDTPEEAARNRELLAVFGAPHSMVYPSTKENRYADTTARGLGLAALATELGGAGMVDPTGTAHAEQGVLRVLAHVGVLKDASDLPPPEPTRFLRVEMPSHYCYAPDDGLFEPLVELGDEVKAGQPAGAIHFPETPWREPSIAHFERDGLVICKRVPGRSERGDCLFHLAADV